MVQGMRAGEIDALVIQNPFAMGDLGVRRMIDAPRRQAPVDDRIDTGVVVITPENMDQPDMARLLSPDLSILGN